MSGNAPTAARVCALTVIRRVFEDGAWADRALHGEAGRLELDPRERALATRLAYGDGPAPRHARPPDRAFAGRPTDRLEPIVRAALRLGLYQLAYLDRVPAHAAVTESVELVKPSSPGGAKLVNAVLRRGAREAAAAVAALPEATPAEAALRHSHPEWIAALWFDALGPDAARALMAADNEPAEAALRANTLRGDAAALAAELPLPTHPAPGLPEGLLLDAPFDAFDSPLWHAGRFMPQSRAAMTVARIVGPRPGERVLDLCAAPGGKTTHLAALMEDTGAVVAVERHPGRAEALRRTARRMGASCVTVRTADASAAAGRRVRPRARRPALLGPRHARLAPRRPLAQGRRHPAPARADAGGDPRGRRRRRPPGRHAGLQHLHDLARRERGRRARRSSPGAGTSAPTTCATTSRCGTMGACQASCRRSRTATGPRGSSSRGSAGSRRER